MKGGIGRPSLIHDEETVRRVLMAATLMPDTKRVAKLAKIPRRTLSGWLQRGNTGEEPYASFVVAYDAAQTEVEYSAWRALAEMSEGDWRAAAAFIELRAKHVVDHKQEALDDMTDEEQLDYLASIPEVRDRVLLGQGSDDSAD